MRPKSRRAFGMTWASVGSWISPSEGDRVNVETVDQEYQQLQEESQQLGLVDGVISPIFN